MKKFTILLLTLLMTISLMGCIRNSEPTETSSINVKSSTIKETSASESNTSASQTKNENIPSEIEETKNNNEANEVKVLVAYFSATNTTEGIAKHITDELNADLYEIVPEHPYTNADLNYNDDNSRSTIEMNNPSARPAISSSVENMEQYDIVFIGYPIWWGEAPRIVSTFIESYDFSGKTIVPFCTSGSSGIGSSVTNLQKLMDGAEWLSGQRLNGSSSRDEIVEWVNSLGLDITTE